MKFMIGILLGAATTLFLASSLNSNTDELVQQGRSAWTLWQEKWAQVRSDTPSASTETSQIALTVPLDLPPTTPSPSPRVTENTEEIVLATAIDDLGDTNPQDGMEITFDNSSIESSSIDHSFSDLSSADLSSADLSSADLSSADHPSTTLPMEEEHIAVTMEVNPLTAGEAIVWSPFHSEASATGFASRLSGQLERPFEVRKQGPANYVVSFTYTDLADKQATEVTIASVTGAKP